MGLGRCPWRPWKQACSDLGKECQDFEQLEGGVAWGAWLLVKVQLWFLGLALWGRI